MIKIFLNKFIKKIKEKNDITFESEEFKPRDMYSDEYYEELKKMESNNIIECYKPSYKLLPQVTLTPKGAYLGKEFIDNYYELYNYVEAYIKLGYDLKKYPELSRELNEEILFIEAVFWDLKEKHYITMKKQAHGWVIELTERGIDYFNNN